MQIEKLFPFFVNKISHEIYFINPQGKIIFANEYACSKLGYKKEELLQLKVSDLDPLFKEEERPGVWKRLRKIKKRNFRSRHKTKSGQTYPVEITSNYLQHGRDEYEGAFARDITERKLVEKKVKTQEILLELAGSLAQLGAWTADLKENRVIWSQEVSSIHGREKGYSPTIKEGINFYAPEYRAKIKEVFSACANDGKAYDEELQIINSRGQRVWVRTMGVPVYDENGEIFKVRGGFQDINRFKKAETKIKKILKDYEMVFHSTQNALFLVNVEDNDTFRYMRTNKAHQEATGIPSKEISGKTPEELLGKEVGMKISANYRKCLKSGSRISYEEKLKLPGGEKIWYTSLTPVFEANKILSIVGSSQNITERKLSVARAMQQADLSRLIAEVSANFIDVKSRNIDIKINKMLKKCSEFFGVDRAYFFRFSSDGKRMSNTHEWCAEGIEPQKNNIQDFPVNKMPWVYKKIRSQKGFYVKDINNLPPDALNEKKEFERQNIKSLLCVTVRNKKSGLVGFIGFDSVKSKKLWKEEQISLLYVLAAIVSDALESIKMEKQMIHMQKMESIGRLAGGVAHEINNPLGSILAAAQLILEETDKDDPIRQNLKIIEESAKRSASVVRKLLDFSRKGTGERGKIDLNRVIKNVFTMINRQVEFKDIKIIESLQRNLPAVEADSQNMEQVFLNLFINARDAMSGGGKLTVETKQKEEKGNRYVTVTVSDTGGGMSEYVMERLFEPFFTTKMTGAGTGLGMPIVKNILKGIGAGIKIKSVPGKGTEFKIIIPAAKE